MKIKALEIQFRPNEKAIGKPTANQMQTQAEQPQTTINDAANTASRNSKYCSNLFCVFPYTEKARCL